MVIAEFYLTETVRLGWPRSGVRGGARLRERAKRRWKDNVAWVPEFRASPWLAGEAAGAAQAGCRAAGTSRGGRRAVAAAAPCRGRQSPRARPGPPASRGG